MNRSSIAGRLMLWLGGGMILFWLGATALGVYVMRDEFDEVFDSGLQETAQRLMPLVIDDLLEREEFDTPRRLGNVSEPEHDEYLTYQVRDKTGRVLLHSHDAQPRPFDAALTRGFTDTSTQRIYTEVAVTGTLFLQIADTLAHRREATMEAAAALVIPILLLAPLSTMFIWHVVRRSTAPILALSDEIGSRDGATLTPLRTTGIPAELQGIATSVDHLFERLRAAIDAERQFTANTAHELRTPLAGALAQTQRLIIELGNGREGHRARQIEASIRNLTRLIDRLLQLARAEAGIGAATSPTDIVPIVRMVAEDFRGGFGAGERLHLDLPQSATIVRSVDVDALAIVLRNLIDNAILHGTQDDPITVRVDEQGELSVQNGGNTIPTDQLQGLLRRFQRGPTSSVGSGLGLSIADMLVRQMGGSLKLASPATGRQSGFEVRVRLKS
jgi:two-component system OmpR family sensor kinase